MRLNYQFSEGVKPKFEQAIQTLEPLKWAEDEEVMKVLMSKNPIWGGYASSILNNLYERLVEAKLMTKPKFNYL